MQQRKPLTNKCADAWQDIYLHPILFIEDQNERHKH